MVLLNNCIVCCSKGSSPAGVKSIKDGYRRSVIIIEKRRTSQRIIFCVRMAADAAEYNTPFDHETAALWKTSCSLLYCPSCAATHQSNQVLNEIMMQDTNQSSADCGPRSCFPWLRNLQCSNCSRQWPVCIDCENVRKPFVTRDQVRRHTNARKHFLIPSTTDRSRFNIL
jgi:hypothetical protein